MALVYITFYHAAQNLGHEFHIFQFLIFESILFKIVVVTFTHRYIVFSPHVFSHVEDCYLWYFFSRFSSFYILFFSNYFQFHMLAHKILLSSIGPFLYEFESTSCLILSVVFLITPLILVYLNSYHIHPYPIFFLIFFSDV